MQVIPGGLSKPRENILRIFPSFASSSPRRGPRGQSKEEANPTKQLIVNADDLGLTQAVSQGIIDAHLHGMVTSASLMANGNAFQEAVALTRQCPELGIGVHLNLTDGKPVSPASEVRSLVTSDGQLRLSLYGLWIAILTGKIRMSEIETELRAQIDKIVDAGVSPTHLDGHKHAHVLPGISGIVMRLAQEYGISSLRCPIEERPSVAPILRGGCGCRTGIFKQRLIGRAVSRLAHGFKRKLGQAGLNCPGHFYGLTQTGFLNEVSIAEILTHLQEGTSELMCHPGYADAELLRTGTRLLNQRVVELRSLSAPEIRKLAGDEGIQLVSYRELSRKIRANGAPGRRAETALAQSARRLD